MKKFIALLLLKQTGIILHDRFVHLNKLSFQQSDLNPETTLKISNHKIDREHSKFDEIDKTSGSFGQGLPDTIIIHYTAGPSVSSAVNTFKDPSVKASAHVVIDHDGTITQLIPFNKIGWHAGESSWHDRNRSEQLFHRYRNCECRKA